MKQQILNLKKKLLIVEIGGELSTEFLSIMNEYGMAEILGKLTDITEELFAEWVKSNILYDYADYTNNEICILPTAKESFFSYLEKEGIYFENLLPRPADVLEKIELLPFPSPVGYQMQKDWQEAEEKVWNLENCYIFEII